MFSQTCVKKDRPQAPYPSEFTRFFLCRKTKVNSYVIRKDFMKYTRLSPFLLALSLNIMAQEKVSKEVSLEVVTGSSGGSYYDIPRGLTGFDKYGTERLSPTGYYFAGTLSGDEFGRLYFRKISVDRKEDKTNLGTQKIFRYETPAKVLKDADQFDFFVKGDVVNYSQKDHFIYFRADGEHTPGLDKNLQLEDHLRTNQRQTYVMPMLGICREDEFSKGQFDFETFVSLGMAPIGFINYDSKVTDNQHSHIDEKDFTSKGSSLAAGAELNLVGMFKYKDRYYFKVSVQQNVLLGANKDRTLASNRTTQYEVGFKMTDKLSAGIQAENNELLLLNKNRHAIDVFNNVGLGLKYQIPYRKK
jgi:hypothetical protein